MKQLICTSILLFSLCSSNLFSQENDTIGLKKLFWNVTPFVGLVSDASNSFNAKAVIASGGLLYKMGNNWLIKKRERSATFFKLTWVRIGVYPQGLILTPLHVGAGLHYDFNKKSSMELSLNGGLVISTDDALSPSIEFNYLIAPEVKVNLGRFSIGVEYSFRTFKDNFGRPVNRWHYIGLVFGGRAGKTLKKQAFLT